MSTVYFARLRHVEEELAAARKSLAYVVFRWDSANTSSDIDLPRVQIVNALGNVEKTYFIRLFAEWEGILKTHLSANHPSVRVPDKPKVDQLIYAILKTEIITIDPALRRKLNLVRDYRNSLVHSNTRTVNTVAFSDARSWFNTFLAKLPDPRR